jgi:proteasome lid subunit RPN8/RPN11
MESEPDGFEEDNERPQKPATPQRPAGKVYIKADALKKIVLFAKRYANENIPEYDWKEVYGFLIGRIKNEKDVYIDNAEPMTSGEATEVSFNAEHYSKAWSLDNEIAEKHDNSFVAGWWHTHPFKSNPDSIFLSSIDVGNQLGFQDPNPLAIALVHDPSKVKSSEIPYGIKVFRLMRTDFNAGDLDRLALDLNVDGTTKSDPDEIIYQSVPFEIVGITPKLFFESLVDVYEKTVSGAPVQTAYMEEAKPKASARKASSPAKNLTDIRELASQPASNQAVSFRSGSAEWDQDGENEEEGNQADVAGPMPTIVASLANEMEDENKVHVLPEQDYVEADKDAHAAEADETYLAAIKAKKEEDFVEALRLFKNVYRVYSKLEAPVVTAIVKNEIMECEYWNGSWDDVLVESNAVAKLGEEAGDFYFMGNAQEFKGRAFLKKEDTRNAKTALQEAKLLFDKGGYFGKAGQCMELIGRLFFTQDRPDFDSVALFFEKALEFYQQALKAPSPREPDWARSGFLQQHGSVLEKMTREIVARLKDPDVLRKLKSDLDKIGPWD